LLRSREIFTRFQNVVDSKELVHIGVPIITVLQIHRVCDFSSRYPS
jgi:hypothetical protein